MLFGDVICFSKVWKVDFFLQHRASSVEEIMAFFSRQKANNTLTCTLNNLFVTDKIMAKFCVIKCSDVTT